MKHVLSSDEALYSPTTGELRTFVIVQHDCAPPHWSNNVRTFLHKTFAERWVGHGGLIFCPLSSCHSVGCLPVAVCKRLYLQNVCG